MKRSIRSRVASMLAASALLLTAKPATAAAPNYTSWHLNPVTEASWGVPRDFDPRPNAWKTGIVQIIEKHADAMGGRMHFRVRDSRGVREYDFKWRFDRDVTIAEPKKPFTVFFSATGDGKAMELGRNGDVNPRVCACAKENWRDGVERDETHTYYYLVPSPDYTTNERKIADPLLPTKPYRFEVFFHAVTRDAVNGFSVAYEYTGVEGAVPPPPTSGGATPPTGPSTPPPATVSHVNLGGDWLSVDRPGAPALPTKIIQNGGTLTLTNEYHQTSTGRFLDASSIIAFANIPAQIKNGGDEIRWQNGAIWRRVTKTGQPAVSRMTLKADAYAVKAGSTFEVPVWMLKGQGLVDMNFNLTYDPSVVTVAAPVVHGNLLDGGAFEANALRADLVEVGLVPPGGGVASPEGTLATVTFKAVGAVGTRTPLTIVRRKASVSGGADANPDVINGEIVIVAKEPESGDTNQDGKLDQTDPLNALKMSVHLIPVNMNADVDKDSEVTARDARLIAEKVAGRNVF